MRNAVRVLAIFLLACLPAAATTQQTIRVNAAGPAYRDSRGQLWSADYGFNSGTPSNSARYATVTGTTDPTLFKSARVAPPSGTQLQYQFAVTNGTYDVNLYFAETYFTSAGQRVFDVQMQGATVIGALDIFAQAGANRALVKSARVTVANGQMVIQFVRRVNGNVPIVTALEILPVGTAAPPVVSITSPANGATVSGTVQVSGTATSNLSITLVQVSVDGGSFSNASGTGNWSFSLNTASLSNGAHTLTAKATDGGGGTALSNAVSVRVNNTAAPPVVSITSPANGATVSGTVQVSGTATSNLSITLVQVSVDGGSFSNASGTGNWSFSLNTASLSNGAHTLTAKATDGGGGTALSNAVSVRVNNTAAPPVVSITSPANGATVSGTVQVSGTATSNLSITLVQVSVDGGSFSNASGTGNWSFSLNTASLSNGAHTLTAKATDGGGGTALSNAVSVNVNNVSGPTVTINWSDLQQQIDGFGASDAFTGYGITDAQADLFWSTTGGVGLSLMRMDVQPDGTYPDLATMQKAQSRGVRIWGAPWTPPASMKTNQSLTNGGSLLTGSYQAYADYLAGYLYTLKTSYGIDLYALSIQNEPDWSAATWESCIWTGDQLHNFLGNNLNPALAAKGLSTKIMLPEQAGWHFDLATASLNDPVTAAEVAIIAGHDYNQAPAATYPLAQNQGKHLWQSEISSFENFDPSISNGLKWAQHIHDWMTIANANSWHYWELVADPADTANGGLLGPAGQLTKRLFVMGNFSKFVRPGYYRIGTSASPLPNVPISAYKDPNTGKFAIVAINNNSYAVNLSFALNGFTANSVVPWVTSATLDLAQQPNIWVGGNVFGAALPPASVTTFVGP